MERRLDERLRSTADVTCRFPGTQARGKLRNVSRSGCGVVTREHSPKNGGTVLIDLIDGVSVAGEVRWTEDGAYGIEFTDHVHRSLVDLLSSGAVTLRGMSAVTANWPRDRFGRSLPSLSPAGLPRRGRRK